jgi:hypothetical protein
VLGVCLVSRRSLSPCRADRDDHHGDSAGVPGVSFWQHGLVQPGIGRAYLRGETASAQALNADTAYGPALIATAASSVLLWLIGTVFLVVALVRTSRRLRVAGLLYAVSVALFIWSGQVDLIPLQQALAGVLLTVAAVIVALRLPREAS